MILRLPRQMSLLKLYPNQKYLIRTEASVYDYWVKQGFGSSGIRNFIIDSMLQYVNEVPNEVQFWNEY